MSAPMRWSPDEASEPLAPGTVVAGRFEVHSVVASGGMGAVYRAEDRRIGRVVALKLLHVPDGPAAERFIEEARAASRISSRHVAAIHDFGDDEEYGRYMVMELLNGRSLAAVLASRGALSPRQAATIAADIAEALAAAHDGGVVHRDLKPGNVILLDEGGVKVIDFGIATLEEAGAGTEETIVGTPIYISPEAVQGEVAIGPAADLYALGVLLHEMLVGAPPFYDDDPQALCVLHVCEPVPQLADVAPGLEFPDEIQPLLNALLEKAPDMRPRDAREVALTLRALSDTTGVIRHDARTPKAQAETAYTPRPSLPLGSAPRVAIAATLLLGVGVVAFLVLGRFTTPSPEPTPEARPAPVAAPPALEEPPPGLEAPEPAAPAEVTIEVRTSPPSARLRLDGQPVESPFVLSLDHETHELEVSARGHRTERRELSAERDAQIEVVLRRARRAPALPAELQDW